MAGGKATLLHQIFQKQGILPHEVWELPERERAFVFASTIIRLEAQAKEAEKRRNGGR